MRGKRRLLWQHLGPFWFILTLSFVTLGLITSTAVRSFHHRETLRHLALHLRTVRIAVKPMVLAKDATAIDRFCKADTSGDLVRITIIDRDGRVLGDSMADPHVMENHRDRPEVKSALAGRLEAISRFSETLKRDLLYVAKPIYKGKTVVAVARIALPSIFLQETIRSIYKRLVLFGLLGMLLMAGASFLILRQLSRASSRLVEGADRFARGDLSHRIRLKDDTYLKRLAKTMNLMAGQLGEHIHSIEDHQRELDVLLASMSEPIVAVDAQGVILRTNAAFDSLFDITEGKGASVFETILCTELHDYVRSILAGEDPGPMEIEYTNDGCRLSLAASGNLLDWARGRGAIIVLTDLTRIRKLEQVRREFVANVSHELRTPITVIKGYGETLSGQMEEGSMQAKFIEKMRVQAERLEQIVEDLLALSRLEGGDESAFVRSPQKLSSLVRQAVGPLEEKAAARRMTVVVQGDEEISVLANAPLVIQAISNLVDNAVKYGRSGTAVEVHCRGEAGQAVLTVEDRGEGIEAPHLERIFERFYRVDKGRSRAMGGTGLGLSIVKHVVQVHGGQVSVTSVPGEGTTFTVTLPLERTS